MRDHTKLKAFHLADELVLAVYRETRSFPKEELFGMTSQVRRAALSVPSNIVEGCARHTEADYLHFLNMAYGSAKELDYQLSVAFRLGYLAEASYEPLREQCDQTCRTLNALMRSLRK